MKEKTDALHESYYRKFGELRRNIDNLTDEAYMAIAKNLLEEYLEEYALMRLEDGIETSRKRYGLITRANELEPRRIRHHLLFRRPNRAADQLTREMLAEIEEFFERHERALEQLEAALAQTENAEPEDILLQPEPEPDTQEEPATDPGEERQEPPKDKPQKPPRTRRKRSQPDGQLPGQISLDGLGQERNGEESDR